METLQKVAFRLREIVKDNQFNNVIFQKSTAKIMGHVENGNVWVQDNLKSFQICYGIKYLMKIGSVVEYTHLGYNA